MRKIQKILLLLSVACVFVLSSCEDKITPESSGLEVSVQTPTVGFKAGNAWVEVKCGGAWRLSVECPGAETPWADVNVTEGTGNNGAVRLSYKANDSDERRILILTVERQSDGKTETCTVTQVAFGEDINAAPKPEIDMTKAQWLELPKLDPELGLEYYGHNFEMNGKIYRNYSFGWSQKDLVSVWVAYPLCPLYTNGDVGRTDAWNYDPLLGTEKSSAPFGGYGSYYARGHQLPSADRQCCREANAQTFYGTNITPQLFEHNSPFWSSIEGKVRTWANTSDTTYVVTGCVVKGDIEKTTDSDGKDMTVPVAYWKALLRYHEKSTISKWACMAIYTEHKDYGKFSDFKSLSMSIDELEEITGLDFFPNLPARLNELGYKESEKMADDLEAQDPKTSNIWW